MPNQHIQEIIDEQTRQVNSASENCSKTYGPFVGDKLQIPYFNETSQTQMCHAFWDTILCWPPTPAGEVATLSCPGYVIGFRTEFNATRICTENSTWYVNESTNEFWANYTSCMDSPIATVFKEVQRSDVSPTSKLLLKTIKIISQTGYAVSLVSLIIAFLIMLLIKKLHCARNILHMNLFASFILRAFFYILKDILFYEGVGLWYDLRVKDGDIYFRTDTKTNNFECKLLTSLLQYFTTANYSWILMEGVYLNNLIFRALLSDSSKSMIHYICFGWGLPLAVIIPWILARLLLEDTTCWTMNDNPVPLLIIGIPTIISVMINLVLFVIISIVLYTKLRSPINEDTKKYQKWAKSTLVLVPLFGVHYAVLLVFYFVGQTTVWLIFDMMFGCFQGFFVAVLYCFLNGEVKTEMKPHIYSFLTYIANHKVLRLCFPCREIFLRSVVGRQSVCTTMSCSSLYANGVGHCNGRPRWEIFHRQKHPILSDKTKIHANNKDVEQAILSEKRAFSSPNCTKVHIDSVLTHKDQQGKIESTSTDEEASMLNKSN